MATIRIAFTHNKQSPPPPHLVGHDAQRDVVLLLVTLNRLERVVTVPRDPLVDREQHEIEPVVVFLVEEFEHVREHGRVCVGEESRKGGMG